MQNIKEAQSNGLYQAFNSSQELRHKTLGNSYKGLSTIVFIDSGVDDYQSLVNGAIPEAEVIVLDSTRDGVVQITEVLQKRSEIATIHIVSHGSPGCLYLGNTQLRLDTLERYASQLQTWATPLFPSSLLLYGCNVAAGDAGAEFVERLHQLTGANIAASANRTGFAALGGDWELEVAIGKIEVPLAFDEEATEAYTCVLAVFNVTNTNDSGAGSLRQAILDANAALTDDLIVFNPELSGQTITLTSGQLEITDDLFIDGLGENNLTVSGNNASRAFLINDGNDSNLINVEIEGLTISNGRGVSSFDPGGGILNYENLTVTNSIISNNESVQGAGIANVGTLKLFGSTVSGNENPGFPFTGGAFTGGGGIYNYSTGSLEIDSSTISNNKATRGGGIANQGSLNIINSTISGNESADGGGGILNSGSNPTADISFSTITNNTGNIGSGNFGSGGGIVVATGTTAVNNTIIAGNESILGNNPDVGGNFISNGNNLIGDLTGSSGFNATEDLTVPITSVIDITLTNNGGPTQTHALVPGSPAIDAVSVPSGITTDQRSVFRPFGSNPDIGAVEFVPLFDVSNITVDTLVDENDGDLSAGDVSLREAILFSSAGGTINFSSSLADGTITLTQGELVINKNLTINGLGASNLTVSGGSSDIFSINDAEVEIQGLTIANGNDGIKVNGNSNLTLTDSIITSVGDDGITISGSNNTVTVSNSTISNSSGDDGLEINGSNNTVTVTNSTISENEDGLAVEGNNNTVTVIDSTISLNSEDGIEIDGSNNTVTVTNHTTISENTGDGIDITKNGNTVEVSQSTISLNTESGIELDEEGSDNTVTVTCSTISENKDSGIKVEGNNSTVTVSDSDIVGNFAEFFGGGIYNDQGTVTIANSTISGNQTNKENGSAGGGIYNIQGTVAVTDTTISNNYARLSGGGIFNSFGTATVTNSTISGNTAEFASGGGIDSFAGTLTVTNSTISGNTAGTDGGGINTSSLTVINSTITDNTAGASPFSSFSKGGGISSLSGGTIKNTIIAGNSVDTQLVEVSRDVYGFFNTTDSSFNLIGDGTGSNFTDGDNGNIVGTSCNPIDPLLGPLQDNGGPTFTHALLPGSPAINAGNNANIPDGITTDQRGEPRIVGDTVDIGAFEAALFSPIVICGCEHKGDPWNTTNNHQLSAFSTDTDINLIPVADCWV